jgi:hypothetical protein
MTSSTVMSMTANKGDPGDTAMNELNLETGLQSIHPSSSIEPSFCAFRRATINIRSGVCALPLFMLWFHDLLLTSFEA